LCNEFFVGEAISKLILAVSHGLLDLRRLSAYAVRMATLVHLTSAKLLRRILRAGIKPEATHFGSPGVFALPVTPNYVVSHQWTRELRKWGRGRIVAVYFRVPDNEPVKVGHYSRPHEDMTAAQAAAALMHQGRDALGFEVVVPRGIPPQDITRTRLISSRVGWRHYPGAHSRRPCGCPACVTRGEYNSQHLRERFEHSQRSQASQ
jgi:hypothetical protein